ncbi:Mov34/MPN/PAD-1 family protein [Cytobacillus firmus]|uniref:Mov34/MPN/PAD-1 family protein n=1 Tax=Cytobacillus firmus TaxID=1399 RepID=UPI0021C7D17F|nr:Mov34/MPN/PAD-1 family protein [Cytobacillus firmus]MCU1808237.1 Mov34/MPN/PAD-1 family protein [Cytobacillus firmus]
MIFQRPAGGFIKISEQVLAVVHQYIQLGKGDREAGGVLLGRFIEGSSDIVIDKVTVPMERDIRKRCFFQKNKYDHQTIVHTIWEKSEGTCNYLGEWHTHPEPHPAPSLHDIREWKKVLKYTVCDSDEIFFIIIGTESLGFWVGYRSQFEIKKLARC